MERMIDAATATGAPRDPRPRLLHARRWRRRRSAITDRAAPRSRRCRATAAIESGSPTALAQADYARGVSFAADDPGAGARAVRPQRRSAASRSATVGSARSRSPRASGSARSRAIRSARSPATATSSTPGSAAATGRTCGSRCATCSRSSRRSSATSPRRRSTARSRPRARSHALPLEPSSADEFALVVKRVTERLDPTVLADADRAGPHDGRRGGRALRARGARRRRRPRSIGEGGGPRELGRAVAARRWSARSTRRNRCSSTEREGAVAQVVGEVVAVAVAERLRRWPSWCSPRWDRPSSGGPGSGGPRAGRSAPGTPASRPPGPAAGPTSCVDVGSGR